MTESIAVILAFAFVGLGTFVADRIVTRIQVKRRIRHLREKQLQEQERNLRRMVAGMSRYSRAPKRGDYVTHDEHDYEKKS